jgi:SAM-dependent methyltransferase
VTDGRSHRGWYDSFYSRRDFMAAGPWYIGASSLLAAQVPDLTRRTVLEVGCGTGAFISLVEAGKRIGVDPSFEACSLTRSAGVATAEAVAESLPFGDGTVDVVVLCEVIEHVMSPPAVLREIRRVLRDDGLLILSFPNYLNAPWLLFRLLAELFRKPNWIELQPRDRILTHFSITRLFRAAGFRKVGLTGHVLEPPGIFHRRQKRGLPPLKGGRLAFICFHPVYALRKSGPLEQGLGGDQSQSRFG